MELKRIKLGGPSGGADFSSGSYRSWRDALLTKGVKEKARMLIKNATVEGRIE